MKQLYVLKAKQVYLRSNSFRATATVEVTKPTVGAENDFSTIWVVVADLVQSGTECVCVGGGGESLALKGSVSVLTTGLLSCLHETVPGSVMDIKIFTRGKCHVRFILSRGRP